MMPELRRRDLGLLLTATALLAARPSRAADDEPWDFLRSSLFEGRPIEDGAGVIALEAPVRAYDAAVVPVTITASAPSTPERAIRRLHLIVDKNPAPLAAIFHLPEGGAAATLGTRIRVNEYTMIRAVAETADGRLWMTQRFVKAAGGCSAPGSKDKAAAMARLGRMKLKQLAPFAAGQPLPLELLVSHPQYTGMQIDQLTRNWIPSDYVRTIVLRWNGRPLLEVEGDISLSEDPAVAFSFTPEAPGTLEAVVDDSEGRHFDQSWPLGLGS